MSATAWSSVSPCSRVSVRWVSKLSASATAALRLARRRPRSAPGCCERVCGVLPVGVVGGHDREVAGLRERHADHLLVRVVPRVALAQPQPQALARIGDLPPALDVGEGVLREVVAAARAEEGLLVREVAIHRDPADAGALGDLADRRLRGADRLVELDRRFDDPLPGLVLLLRATLQLVSCGSSQTMIQDVSRNLTRVPEGCTVAVVVKHACFSK